MLIQCSLRDTNKFSTVKRKYSHNNININTWAQSSTAHWSQVMAPGVAIGAITTYFLMRDMTSSHHVMLAVLWAPWFSFAPWVVLLVLWPPCPSAESWVGSGTSRIRRASAITPMQGVTCRDKSGVRSYHLSSYTEGQLIAKESQILRLKIYI